jgi:tRNA dimethylallyltransferase
MDARELSAGDSVPAVMVGGSGLYVEAVVRDYRLADVPNNAGLRAYLQVRDAAELAAELQRRSPEIAQETDMSSKRRVIRALEIAEYGETHEVEYGQPPGVSLRFSVFGIDASRDEIRGRITTRLRERLDEGMIEEVQGLLDRGLEPGRLRELGLEYREVAAYLLGEKGRDQMIEDLEFAIARFAKRQQTWFRGMERRGTPIRWIDAGDIEAVMDGYGNDRDVS